MTHDNLFHSLSFWNLAYTRNSVIPSNKNSTFRISMRNLKKAVARCASILLDIYNLLNNRLLLLDIYQFNGFNNLFSVAAISNDSCIIALIYLAGNQYDLQLLACITGILRVLKFIAHQYALTSTDVQQCPAKPANQDVQPRWNPPLRLELHPCSGILALQQPVFIALHFTSLHSRRDTVFK